MNRLHPWLLTLTLIPAASGQDPAAPSQDRTAIHWVLPGDFEAALARAKTEQRILVIKGISFGVDDAGSKCATKGVW